MKNLTHKRQEFVNNKAAGMKNLEAAVAAGFAPKSAASMAAQLMGRTDIKKAIALAKKSPIERQLAADRDQEEFEDDIAKKNKMPKANYADSKQFLLDAMNHKLLPIAARAEYAKALLPYQHGRIGEQGKKEKVADRAKEVAHGGSRLQPKSPPRLHAVK